MENRLLNFLVDDLSKLNTAIKENNTEYIDQFFSYWDIHLRLLLVKVYDNGGETFDRYTVILPDGSVFGMSYDATGFNQYVGDIGKDIEAGDHLGVLLPAIPEEIKYAVIKRMN